MEDAELPPAIADPRLPTDSPFTVHQAASVGVGRHTIARLKKEGLIRQVVRSVYVDASATDTLDLRAAAIALLVHPDAVITDLSAAWLHGARVNSTGDYLPSVSVYQLPEHTRVRTRATTGGTRTLESDDIESISGLRVTTPLRTALDLGRLLKRGHALAALDGLLRLSRFTVSDLQSQLPRLRGYRGVVQLRSLIPIADGRSESPQESVLRLRWLEAGLPTPQPQWVVKDENGFPVYRLDLADPRVLYAAEYDGQDHHFTREQRSNDERRRAWLRRRGWIIDVLDGEGLASRTVGTRLWSGHRRARLRRESAA